jgi:hypothetical protein
VLHLLLLFLLLRDVIVPRTRTALAPTHHCGGACRTLKEGRHGFPQGVPPQTCTTGGRGRRRRRPMELVSKRLQAVGGRCCRCCISSFSSSSFADATVPCRSTVEDLVAL